MTDLERAITYYKTHPIQYQEIKDGVILFPSNGTRMEWKMQVKFNKQIIQRMELNG